MRTVRIHEAASQEAIEAAAWYENERTGLGVEFQRAIDVALDLLEEGNDWSQRLTVRAGGRTSVW